MPTRINFVLERQEKEINFDPLLSKDFFVRSEFTKDLPPVGFPLPTSVENMEKFFQQKRTRFRKGFFTLIDDIGKWVKAQQLPLESLQKFAKTYGDYTGTNQEMNEINFPLYQEGIPALGGIAKLIENKEISLDVRKDVMEHLLTVLNVCGPGIHTHIIIAYFHLLSRVDLKAYWTLCRLVIAQQHMVELLKQHHVPENIEIHYINGVLNFWDEVLAISLIPDKYVYKVCNQDLLQELIEKFKQSISSKLTAKTVIEYVMSDLNIANLSTSLKNIPGSFHRFEMALKGFGEQGEKEFIQDYCRIFDQDNFQLTWEGPYILFSSLVERLTPIFNLYLQQKFLHDENVIYYFPDDDLRFTYCFSPQKNKYFPFVPYCIQTLAKGKPEEFDLLIAFLKSNFSDELRLEIINAMANYLHSSDYNESLDQENQLAGLLKSISYLFDPTCFDKILLKLPLEVARSFIFDLPSKQANMFTQLHAATLLGCFDLVYSLLANHMEDVNALSPQRNTALHYAAQQGYTNIINLLINNGASLAIQNDQGLTPIQVAVQHHQWNAIAVSFASVTTNKTDSYGYGNALVAAANNNLYAVVMALLTAKASVDRRKDGNTALHYAVLNNNCAMVALLLKCGASANERNDQLMTPMMFAVRNRFWDCIFAFTSVQLGSRDDADYGRALLKAVQERKTAIAKALLNAGASINWRIESTQSGLLHLAGENNDPVMIRILLEHLVRMTDEDINHQTPIQLAANKKHWECVLEFANYPPDENDNARYGYALFKAVQDNKVEIAFALLQAFNLKTQRISLLNKVLHYLTDENKNHILHFAVNNNNSLMIKLLLEHGIIPDVRDTDQRLPIELAAEKGYWDCVMTFVHYHHPVWQLYSGKTLITAMEAGQAAVVQILLQKVSLTQEDQTRILLFCDNSIDSEMKEVLMNHFSQTMPLIKSKEEQEWQGALITIAQLQGVNQFDESGMTVLMHAAQKNQLFVVKKLLTSYPEINVDLINYNTIGKTAYDLTTDPEIKELCYPALRELSVCFPEKRYSLFKNKTDDAVRAIHHLLKTHEITNLRQHYAICMARPFKDFFQKILQVPPYRALLVASGLVTPSFPQLIH